MAEEPKLTPGETRMVDVSGLSKAYQGKIAMLKPQEMKAVRTGAPVVEYTGADLYPKQREAIFAPERIALIEGAVKSGKTISCLAWLLEETLRLGRPGRNFWWVAPVFSQAEIGFRRMKARLPKEIYKPNQSTLTLTLKNGARIQFRSGERPDDLYGEDVFAVVMDEASRMREEAWHAIRSTLTKTVESGGGRVRIIGNVRGRKNWFYELARLAEQGEEADMSYAKLTAYDAVEAGVLSRTEIESARRHYGQLGQEGIFRQLYLAEASDEGDNPFGLAAIEACLVDHLSTNQASVAGVDLAGRGAVNVNQTGDPLARDWTAIVMLDREGCATLVERFRKPHTETSLEIARMVSKTPALIDSTGAGDPIVEILQRRGDMRVEGYTYTERSRQELLEGLALAIGGGRVHFPDGVLRDELDKFEFHYSRRGVRFAVPVGHNDDVAMALALAVHKMPWRRLHTPSPTGIATPGGSRWHAAGSDNDAWRRYQDSLKPTQQGIATEGGVEDTIPSRARPPAIITGPGAGRWTRQC